MGMDVVSTLSPLELGLEVNDAKERGGKQGRYSRDTSTSMDLAPARAKRLKTEGLSEDSY